MKVGKSFKASDLWKQISVIPTRLINQFQSLISLARLNHRPSSGLRYFSLLYSDALWQKRDTTRVLSFFHVGRVSDTPRFRRVPTGFCFSPIALAVSADLLGGSGLRWVAIQRIPPLTKKLGYKPPPSRGTFGSASLKQGFWINSTAFIQVCSTMIVC